MKTTYECEKCGAKYDHWNPAMDCEKSHIGTSVILDGSKWGNSEIYPEYANFLTVEMQDGARVVYVLDEDATEKLHKAMRQEQIKEAV